MTDAAGAKRQRNFGGDMISEDMGNNAGDTINAGLTCTGSTPADVAENNTGCRKDKTANSTSIENIHKGIELLKGFEKASWSEKSKWWFDADLKYSQQDPGSDETRPQEPEGCSNLLCPKRSVVGQVVTSEEGKLLKCGKCKANYCSRECQVAAWKRSHKRECPLVASFAEKQSSKVTLEQQHVVLEEIFRRVRMYMNPYAVAMTAVRGNGFVLLRSNSSLGDWLFEECIDAKGRALQRFVRLQFLTLGEFDALAFEDDFEMAQVRPALLEALEACDPEKQVTVLSILRCGTFSCVTIPLVPERRICASIAVMYKYAEMDGPLQLCVDEQD